MARPVKRRRVCGLPETKEFSPCAEAAGEAVELTVDEYESVRLIDYVGLTQEGCAAQMNVARTTVQAIYDSARKKIADTLVNGRRLLIRGGSYDVCPDAAACCGKDCGGAQCRGHRCGGAGPCGRAHAGAACPGDGETEKKGRAAPHSEGGLL